MWSSLVVVIAVLVLGNEACERLRVKQEEYLLNQLRTEDAAAYYDKLVRRVRRTRILRGVVLICLVLIVSAVKEIWRLDE